MGRSVLVVSALVLVEALAACGPAGSDAGSGPVVKDSAGVTVVSNPEHGTWGPGDAWRVEPVLSIGSSDDDDGQQFGRVTGIDVDAEGRVYVADSQNQTVRVYDAAGRLVGDLGRPGAGPGELGRAILGVFLIADTVFIPEAQYSTLSRFALDGSFLGSDRIDVMRGLPISWDVAAGPRLVAQLRPLLPGDTVTAPRGDPVVTLDPRAEKADTLVVLPVGQSAQIAGDQPRIRMLAPEPVWDADVDGRLVTAMNDAWRFEVRDEAGALGRIITRVFPPRPVTARDRRVILQQYRSRLIGQGAPPAAVDEVMQVVSVADTYPAFASLALGPRGSLWVQHERTGGDLAAGDADFDPRDLASPFWSVFDADGRYLGDVAFPQRFQPLRVRGDRFYGVARDEFDVESLAVFRVLMR